MIGLLKSKLALGVGAALLLTSLSAAAMTKLYLGKRDELATQKLATDIATARAQSYIEQLLEEQRRVEMLELLRIDLAKQIEALGEQEIETITEIREVWRTEVINNPVAVECAAEPVPDSVLSLLCHTDNRGACADLQAGA